MKKRQYRQMKSHCRHRHQTVGATGGFHFSYEIGVWDDIHEYVVCTDCGKILERGTPWKRRVRDYYSIPSLPELASAEEDPFVRDVP